jgi:hypothetical protein
MNKAFLKYKKILQSFHLNKLLYDQNVTEILNENISFWQIIKSLTNGFFRGEDLQYHCRFQIIIHTFLLFLFFITDITNPDFMSTWINNGILYCRGSRLNSFEWISDHHDIFKTWWHCIKIMSKFYNLKKDVCNHLRFQKLYIDICNGKYLNFFSYVRCKVLIRTL